jgi:type IV fimbrial biogenesis protein FimT
MMRSPVLLLAARPGSRRSASAGFTLIELMITLAVAASLVTLAVPSFNEAMLGSKLNTLSNNFVASAQLARSEAIKRNTAVTLCASSDGSTCTGAWGDGWVVLATDGTVISRQIPLPNGFRLSGDVTTIAFQPTGVGATSAVLTLCRATPTVGTQARTIQLSATGRPGVTKLTGVTTCS